MLVSYIQDSYMVEIIYIYTWNDILDFLKILMIVSFTIRNQIEGDYVFYIA